MNAPKVSQRRIRRLTASEVESYDLVPAEVARRVWLIKVADLPGPYVGMSLGRFLLLTLDIPPDGRNVLLAHELIHARQWTELGLIGFGFRYLRDFARGLLRHRSWQPAYLQIEAEREARALSERWFKERFSTPT